MRNNKRVGGKPCQPFSETRNKKEAPETAYSLSEKEYQQTVISSASTAKILQSIDDLKEKILNLSSQPKTVIGDVAFGLEINKNVYA